MASNPDSAAAPGGVVPQCDRRAVGRVDERDAHQDALLDELDLHLEAQDPPVPVPAPGDVGHGELDVVEPAQPIHANPIRCS